MTINEAKQYSLRAHGAVWNLLEGRVRPSRDQSILSLAYLSLVLEHQKAIVSLVDLNLRGSAFALLRPQVETAFRGLWVGRIATDQQIADIDENDAVPFPEFREMAKKVDEAYHANGILESITGVWKSLNGLTHSGRIQLERRFNDEGTIVPSYADDETESLLLSSAATSTAMAIYAFHLCGFSEELNALSMWKRNNRSTGELGLQEEVEAK
jgi:hypothetical protein